jgi:hypothetical protein
MRALDGLGKRFLIVGGALTHVKAWSSTSALHYQFALHLGKTRHYVKKEAPCGRLGVHAVGDALEMHLLGFKFVNQIHQSLHAAPEPIQFPDHS